MCAGQIIRLVLSNDRLVIILLRRTITGSTARVTTGLVVARYGLGYTELTLPSPGTATLGRLSCRPAEYQQIPEHIFSLSGGMFSSVAGLPTGVYF